MQVRRALVPARSRYALATSFVSTAPHARSARSMSWPPARCRLRFRRSRSEASTIGTAVSSPIRRCNGCWTPRRGRTRSPSKWICGALAAEADEKVYNVIQMIYRKNYAGNFKDYEFSRSTMEEHWRSGYSDAMRTLRHPKVLQRPNGQDGFFTFDLARDGREIEISPGIAS